MRYLAALVALMFGCVQLSYAALYVNGAGTTMIVRGSNGKISTVSMPSSGATVASNGAGGAKITAPSTLQAKSPNGTWIDIPTSQVVNVGSSVVGAVAGAAAVALGGGVIGSAIVGALAVQGVQWLTNKWMQSQAPAPYSGLATVRYVPGYKWANYNQTVLFDTPDDACRNNVAYYGGGTNLRVDPATSNNPEIVYSCTVARGGYPNAGAGAVYRVSSQCATYYSMQNGTCQLNPSSYPMTEATGQQIVTALQNYLSSSAGADQGDDIFNQLATGSKNLAMTDPSGTTFNETGTVTKSNPTTTTTNADGTTNTTTSNTTYNVTNQGDTYSTNTVVVTTTTTSNTSYSNGTSSSTTTTGQTDPAKTEDKANICDSNPEAAACQKLDVPTQEDPQSKSIPVTLTPVAVGGSGACPADVALPRGASWSWKPYCDFATGIKPVVLGLAWVMAGLIIFYGRKED